MWASVLCACQQVWSGQCEQHVWLYGLDKCQPLTSSHDHTPQHATQLRGRRTIRWSERGRGWGDWRWLEERGSEDKEERKWGWKGKWTQKEEWVGAGWEWGNNALRIQTRNNFSFCEWRKFISVSWVAGCSFAGEGKRESRQRKQSQSCYPLLWFH